MGDPEQARLAYDIETGRSQGDVVNLSKRKAKPAPKKPVAKKRDK
jgi:hypothetical protein